MLATKARVPAKDFETLRSAGNNGPTGIWSDGATMWVADIGDSRIYAYNLPEGTAPVERLDPVADPAAFDRVPAKEFGSSLYSANNHDPQGIWSDGATMWVADIGDSRIYAYNLEDKTRVSAKDFDGLKAAGNNYPRGIWSDGATMWVADGVDDKIYAYLTGSRAWNPSQGLRYPVGRRQPCPPEHLVRRRHAMGGGHHCRQALRLRPGDHGPGPRQGLRHPAGRRQP